MRRPFTTPADAIAASLRAAGLPRTARLRNGMPVRIRPVRSDDAPRLNAFVCELSAASRGRRFHGCIGECAPFTVQQLVAVDGVRDVAFIATLPFADGERVIGEARYCIRADADGAELALTVADAWQGQGLGEQLIDCLLEAARDAGVRRLYGEVLASNAQMINFLHRVGFKTCARDAGSGVVRVERGVAAGSPRSNERRVGALRRWLINQFVPRV